MGNSDIKSFNELYNFIDSNSIDNAKLICYVNSINKSELGDYYQLKISLGNEINNQFIIEPSLIENKFNNINDIIGRKINIIKFKFINVGKNIYIKILNFNIQNDKIKLEPKDEFRLNSKNIRSLKEIKSKQVGLFSAILKYKGNNFFEDIDEEQVELNLSEDLIEDKYYFIYNLYYKNNNIRTIPISNICDYNDNKILNLVNNSNIISGEITNVYYYENKIDVKLNNNKEIKILLNNKLMKKISLNLLCHFVNFDKISYNYYKYNSLSSIFYDDKTILRIEFLDYKNNMSNKYNIIEINSQQYSINGNIVEIPILSKDYNNSFVQKIIYKNINNRNQVEFLLELYKGKINDYSSYLNLIKDGYSYEYLYESKYSSLLPEYQKINIENKEIKITNKVTFGNQYRVKFGIINIPNQFINNIAISNDKYEIKSEKLLILLNKNDNAKTFHFKLEENIDKKKNFEMDKAFEKELTEFYYKFRNNYTFFYEHKKEIIQNYNRLFIEEKSPFESDVIPNYSISDELNKSDELEALIFKEENHDKDLKKKRNDKTIKKEAEIDDNEINYRKYIELGFKKYNFKNNKEEYEKITKLCFLYILKYFDYNLSIYNFKFVLDNYFFITKSFTNLEYIDKIHVLLGFVTDKIFDVEKRSIDIDYKLVNLENEYIEKSNKYYSKAYDLFFRIIDKLNEDSAFFICLSQINSSIFYEKTTETKMYSGTMQTLNDIKLEIYKNVKRYFFITKYKGNSYAHFSPYAKMIFYHPLTFLDNKSLSIRTNKTDNATAAILFLIFHEVCGHFKTSITNLDDTPDQFYDDNYNILKYELGEINDSGNIFEYFLCSDIINISELFEKTDVKQLLCEDLYIDKTFSKLNSILTSLNVLENEKNHFTKKFKSNSKLRKILFPDMTKILFRLRIGCKDAQEFQKLINENQEYKLMLEKVKKRYKQIHYKP